MMKVMDKVSLRADLISTDNTDVSSEWLPAFPLLKYNPSNFGHLTEGMVRFRTVL